MRHLGEFYEGQELEIEVMGYTPSDPLANSENPPKYEIIGAGPDFYGMLSGGTIAEEEGKLCVAVEIGAWSPGTYLIRSEWMGVEGQEQEETLLTIIAKPETDDVRGGSAKPTLAPFLKETEDVGTVPYEEDSVPFTYEIVGDELVIRPIEGLQQNHTYSVYVGPEAVLNDGKPLGRWFRTEFDTKVSPLYATRTEVVRELGVLRGETQDRKILTTIRQAGLKAHQMQRLSANVYDAVNFELIEEDADAYYPTTRYVLYETLVQLGNDLYGQFIFGEGGVGGSASESYTLADLQIQGSRDDGSGRSEQMRALLRGRLSKWEQDLAYWQDAMMNRNARGYARAQAAGYRTTAGNPEDRTI